MTTWYGGTPGWWVPVEAAARRALRSNLTHDYRGNHLGYTVRDLEVAGAPATADVTITFSARPPYNTYGLQPQDFPRVRAEPGLSSPHRYPDGCLCLWYPLDPPELRWTSDKGLLDLIEITRRHLYLERYWRMTGAHRGGIWLCDDAPHGFDNAA